MARARGSPISRRPRTGSRRRKRPTQAGTEAGQRMTPQPPAPATLPAVNRNVRDHPLLGPLPVVPDAPFTFDGRLIAARDGEPIAAALLAAGVRIFRTMPRSRAARGGWCMVGRCADCLVVVDGQPNVRACVTPVARGMRVTTQHGLGEDAWDPDGNQAGECAGAAASDRGARM